MKKTINIPQHLAIIPDGNRRWARQRGLKPWEGHERGAQNIEKLIEEAHKIGIKYLTFWGSSVDNLKKRPISEKKALLDIYLRYFKKLSESREIHENQVKINVIGRWKEQFPEKLKRVIYECLKQTAHYQKNFLNFLLAYSGDDEMKEAIKKIVQKYSSKIKITGKLIKENLMTNDLPPVDFMIRTGGEPHLSSGFMMWDVANAQLYFSKKYFPDFGPADLRRAVEEFTRRIRRFGG